MHQIHFRLGVHPILRWGAASAPRPISLPHSWIWEIKRGEGEVKDKGEGRGGKVVEGGEKRRGKERGRGIYSMKLREIDAPTHVPN